MLELVHIDLYCNFGLTVEQVGISLAEQSRNKPEPLVITMAEIKALFRCSVLHATTNQLAPHKGPGRQEACKYFSCRCSLIPPGPGHARSEPIRIW